MIPDDPHLLSDCGEKVKAFVVRFGIGETLSPRFGGAMMIPAAIPDGNFRPAPDCDEFPFLLLSWIESGIGVRNRITKISVSGKDQRAAPLFEGEETWDSPPARFTRIEP